LTGLKLELGYFSGRAWQRRETGGAGVILRFERVVPRRRGRFQPLKESEITPRFRHLHLRHVWGHKPPGDHDPTHACLDSA